MKFSGYIKSIPLVLIVIYCSIFVIQNIRAENKCLSLIVPNSINKAFQYTDWKVSPWTLRADCKWDGMEGISPAMIEYAGAAATPQVASLSTLLNIERLEKKFREAQSSEQQP